ncbi:MAG: hypothetical protein DRN71_00620 [Candidatus Nanohalarchaeota archaeon]|nr:MAG: hypothetical protein DRN71_00620 [Candidatus Nanohaloarchaeota archaeon]
MEFKSVSAKMSREDVTLFKSFCEKKGVSPSELIRELILRELKVPIPHTVAGSNIIHYDKGKDVFVWSVALDTGEKIDVLRNVSPDFLEDLVNIIGRGLDERASFIGKTKKGSVAVPSNILRGEK